MQKCIIKYDNLLVLSMAKCTEFWTQHCKATANGLEMLTLPKTGVIFIIIQKQNQNKNYEIDGSALSILPDIIEYYRSRPNFANARTVRNILEQIIMNQNLRTEENADDNLIVISDVEDYLADEEIDLTMTESQQRRIGFIP